jgi:hypothetical protein
MLLGILIPHDKGHYRRWRDFDRYAAYVVAASPPWPIGPSLQYGTGCPRTASGPASHLSATHDGASCPPYWDGRASGMGSVHT